MRGERPSLVIRGAQWAHDEAALSMVRRCVFIDEQRVPEELEWDGEDQAAWHWLALSDALPVGTVRLLTDGHIGRMAVLAGHRLRGIGSMLLHAAIEQASAAGARDVYLHAQLQALAFYARYGFVGEGEEFMDAGIPHRCMRRQCARNPP